ncbi:MAG: hypothetical protein KJT03_09435 [Verrucomicrobiae bacterium]|nr:hypothetical protein [Verrucomicrobiae bacterium]
MFYTLDHLAEKIIAGLSDEANIAEFRTLTETPLVFDVLAALETVPDKSGCRFVEDFTQGTNIPVNQIYQLHKLSRILGAISVVQANFSAFNLLPSAFSFLLHPSAFIL